MLSLFVWAQLVGALPYASAGSTVGATKPRTWFNVFCERRLVGTETSFVDDYVGASLAQLLGDYVAVGLHLQRVEKRGEFDAASMSRLRVIRGFLETIDSDFARLAIREFTHLEVLRPVPFTWRGIWPRRSRAAVPAR